MGRNGIWRERPTRPEVARCAAALVPEYWRSRVGRFAEWRLGTRRHNWAAVLSERPAIVALALMWSVEQVVERARYLWRTSGARTLDVLVTYWWDGEEPGLAEAWRDVEAALRREGSGLSFVHVCNTERQRELASEQGLSAVTCSNNSFIDERIYRPLEGVTRQHAAIYDARLRAYKRHWLASELDSLALIYGYIPAHDRIAEVGFRRAQLPGAVFCNHRPLPAYRRLPPAEVNELLNRSAVGLCLSDAEGAMFAAIQYLLVGLPIVTTRSRGGRQCFLHEGNHVLVEDDPAAVAEAVRHLVGRCADRAAIRERAIAVMREDRARLIAAVDELVAERGGGPLLSERWDRVFTNRLLTWQCLDDVAARLRTAAGDGTPSPS